MKAFCRSIQSIGPFTFLALGTLITNRWKILLFSRKIHLLLSNGVQLIFKEYRNKRWCVKGWMITPLYRTTTVIQTVNHQKTKEPATLSLARPSKYYGQMVIYQLTVKAIIFFYIEKSVKYLLLAKRRIKYNFLVLS